MIAFEGAILIPVDTSAAQLMIPLVEPTEGAALDSGAIPDAGAGDGRMLQELSQEAEDDWIVPYLPDESPDAAASGTFSASDLVLLDRLSDDGPEIVIIGRRGYEADWGTGSGDSGGGGGGGGGGGSGGSGSTPVEQHTEDCGTEDGAAAQVAKHVMGTLPPGVSGPEDPITSANGNDWRKVEFGALIVQNPNGSFGAFNDTIYSSDNPGYVLVPINSTQPIQGLWHSHPQGVDTYNGQLVSRYPSSADWYALSQVAGQPTAVSDPSLWLTDSFGVTREFKLSERGNFTNLDESQKVKGEGLEGKERAQSCG